MCKCEEKVDLSKVEEILDHFEGTKGSLMPVLQKIQTTYRYLPEAAMEIVSERLNVSMSRIYGVITFYAQFYTTPPGKHIMKLCQGTACHVKGADNIMGKLVERHNVAHKQTTEDGLYTFEEVACLGACAMAPVMTVDGNIYGELTINKVEGILDEYSDEK
ncbi:MAG: NADH-quinone oxidoreductase subunit NuoE [Candidatus Anammoxibacter sp.]